MLVEATRSSRSQGILDRSTVDLVKITSSFVGDCNLYTSCSTVKTHISSCDVDALRVFEISLSLSVNLNIFSCLVSSSLKHFIRCL
jgi:hypothetical protein